MPGEAIIRVGKSATLNAKAKAVVCEEEPVKQEDGVSGRSPSTTPLDRGASIADKTPLDRGASHPDKDRILSSGKLMLEGIKPIVNDVLGQLKEQLVQKELEVSPASIMVIVREAMELVETTALKGIQQKELVNELLLRLVEEATQLSEGHRELCRELVNSGIINETIELVVDATKGKLNVNTLRDVAEETASCCFAFLKRSRKQ
jgi:hypothetical protein